MDSNEFLSKSRRAHGFTSIDGLLKDLWGMIQILLVPLGDVVQKRVLISQRYQPMVSYSSDYQCAKAQNLMD